MTPRGNEMSLTPRCALVQRKMIQSKHAHDRNRSTIHIHTYPAANAQFTFTNPSHPYKSIFTSSSAASSVDAMPISSSDLP